MAVGDVINGISATNTTLDFQPAAGVEVMITSLMMDGSGTTAAFYNGTTLSGLNATFTAARFDYGRVQLFINNTRYLRIPAITGGESGYTGIQIK